MIKLLDTSQNGKNLVNFHLIYMKKVLIKIYAGSGWEGHVVYNAQDPENQELECRTSYIQELKDFCEKNNLLEDGDFLSLVNSKLVLQTNIENNQVVSHIHIIPLEFIDENRAISSAGEYLKREFSAYYGSF